MSISEKIQQLRKSNGLSQEQFAEKLDVSRQAISKWETGISFPDVEKLVLISELFNVSTDYLLKDENTVDGDVDVQHCIQVPQKQEDNMKKMSVILLKVFVGALILGAVGAVCYLLFG